MGSSFLIRRFRRSDARATAELLRKLAAFHGEQAFGKPGHFLKYALGANKLSPTWLAVSGEKAVGFIVLDYGMNYLRGTLSTRVDLLFVEESHRGRGIGKALIAAAVRDALKKGCKRFTIGASSKNALSNKVYAKLGLTKRKKDHVDYSADAALMKRLAHTKGPKT